MVVVSHLFLFLQKSFRVRFDSCESNLTLFGTIYFPTAPLPAGVASPHQQRLVRAVAFRFARRLPVLPCLCKRTDSLQKIMPFRD